MKCWTKKRLTYIQIWSFPASFWFQLTFVSISVTVTSANRFEYQRTEISTSLWRKNLFCNYIIMYKLKCYLEFSRKAYAIPYLCNLLGLSKHALFKGFCIAVFGQQTWILNIHTRQRRYIHPFASVWYEIGLLWPNIKPVRSQTTVLGFWFQTNMNQIFKMRCWSFLLVRRLQKYQR